ncbi:hypothetical protein [Burkholderia cepacia]|uniref:hypothetical protein n=1 Tax=Burkholderia cepacia TaxID=292 RepID=UPI00299008F5|nr:hypothetical protein [Burkholderia cepacia]
MTEIMQRLNWLVLFPLIIATIFIFNPAGLRHDVGDGKGKYIDIVDSFSEYLVRDKIKNEILGTENKGVLLIIPRGYPNNDYTYHADGTHFYYTNLALQAYAASLAARGLNLKTEKQIDVFLAALRFINALLLALILSIFFRRILRDYRLGCAPLVPILLSSLAGLVFFAQNLYFISPIFMLHLLFQRSQQVGGKTGRFTQASPHFPFLTFHAATNLRPPTPSTACFLHYALREDRTGTSSGSASPYLHRCALDFLSQLSIMF